MRSNIENALTTDEQIICYASFHWIHFISVKGLLTLFIVPFIQWLTSDFAITNKRIIVKKGFGQAHYREIKIWKVETIEIDTSIAGRILGYGNLLIIGTGGTRLNFVSIQRPFIIRKIFWAIAENKR
jgi:uncharacterized membrane protein YdbT with pleckstrin-like domain